MAKNVLKTRKNTKSVSAFLNAVKDEQKRKDSKAIHKMMTKATGKRAKMWGSSIVGYGEYHYKSERSKQEGDWMMTGFSPRKKNF